MLSRSASAVSTNRSVRIVPAPSALVGTSWKDSSINMKDGLARADGDEVEKACEE